MGSNIMEQKSCMKKEGKRKKKTKPSVHNQGSFPSYLGILISKKLGKIVQRMTKVANSNLQ
jgi:hypothetical protein